MPGAQLGRALQGHQQDELDQPLGATRPGNVARAKKAAKWPCPVFFLSGNKRVNNDK